MNYRVDKKTLIYSLITSFISSWVIQSGRLGICPLEHTSNIPLLRILFTAFDQMSAPGFPSLFIFVGLAMISYYAGIKSRRKYITGLSAWFAAFVVAGMSLELTSSFMGIIRHDITRWSQLLLSCIYFAGYFFAFRAMMNFAFAVKDKIVLGYDNSSHGKFGRFIFLDHPFAGPFFTFLILGLPVLIFYYPGPLQADSHLSLAFYFSGANKNNFQPVLVTEISGMCIEVARKLGLSDSFGLFLYDFPQYMLQIFGFSYGMWIMSRFKLPAFLRWFSLAFLGFTPFFYLWGYTFSKDGYYYIFFMLLTMAVTDAFLDSPMPQYTLSLISFISAAGVTAFRREGLYVIFPFLIISLIVKKNRKLVFFVGIVGSVLLFVASSAFLKVNNGEKAPIRESLSMQTAQTAYYALLYPGDITAEEEDVLLRAFGKESIREVADLWNNRNADRIKKSFVPQSDSEELYKEYMEVWKNQFKRHPGTYIVANLARSSALMLPTIKPVGYDDWWGYAIFYILNGEKLKDEYVDMEFGIKSTYGREAIKKTIWGMPQIPIVSIFMCPGFYAWAITFLFVYVINNRKWNRLVILFPQIVIIVGLVLGPMNGYTRYMLPIMCLFPFDVMVCFVRERIEV